MNESGIDWLVERSARWIIVHKWLVLLVTLVTVAVLGYGARNLTFVDDYRIYFSDDNPQLLALEALENTYTKNDNILLAVSHQSGSIFHEDAIEALRSLTESAWRLPWSQRVDSIINFQYTYADSDDLIVEGLFDGDADYELLSFEERRAVALTDSRLVNRLIAPDGRVTGVLITFQMPEDDPQALQVLAARVRQLAQEISDSHKSVIVRAGGELMINATFQEVGQKDAVTLTPAMYAGIMLTIGLLLRSVMAVFAVVLLVSLSVIAALGIAGWSGLYLSISSIAAPTMIMTLAVADAVHILVSMFGYQAEGRPDQEALINSLKVNFLPVALTSITTMVGFLTFNFIDVPPFQDFGNISAMGVCAAFLLSVTFLPALTVVLKIHSAKTVVFTSGNKMDKLADFILGHRNKLLVIMLLVSLLLLGAITRNEANNEVIKFFGPEIEFRKDSDYILENLTGVYLVEFSLPAGGSNGITNPRYLQDLDRFALWLEERPEVRHVSILSDTMKRLNMNLHNDDPAYFRLPDGKEAASQYLLLYELSLPYGLDLNNQVNLDKSATRVVVTLNDISTNEIKRFRDISESWLKANTPEMATYAVGASVMFADIFKRSTSTMVNGVVVGLLVISLILAFALRSFKHGLISLLPNLLPAGLAFGLWGLFVGQVNMAVAMVMTMTLGIVVDDTVHFMSKYLRACREKGLSSPDAVRYAVNRVGYALVITSLSLVMGFAIMAQSSFALNADSSMITMTAIILALVVDFLMLPPLLILFDKKRSRDKVVL